MLERIKRAFVEKHAATAAVGAIAALLLTAAPATAQVITGGLRGVVSDPAGTPVAGATVVLENKASGGSEQTTTNSVGAYVFSGKTVGGPYVVQVSAPGFEPFTSAPFNIGLGKFDELPVALRKSSVEEITVVGKVEQRAVSGAAVFDASQVAETPTIARDPKDIIKLMPEAYTDALNMSALSIGGNNTRFNSFTVDGIRQDDDFGLNNQGYPTQRAPISLTAIQEIAIEQSPFDVRYSRFLGGNVNIVTKSGTNDYHSTLFMTYTDGNLAGSKSMNNDVKLDMRQMQYGLAVSGPIIVDKLHFFANVEGFGGTTPFSFGPTGSGATTEVPQVTVDDVNTARQIAQDVYGFNSGVAKKPIDEGDLKVLAKLDWAATDNHHVTATFQRSAGNMIHEVTPYRTTLSLTSNWYDKVETLYTGTLRMKSHWTPEFNTNVELGVKTVDTGQNALNGHEFMQATIKTPDGGYVRLGPDISRQANELNNRLYQAKATGEYLLGNHLITGGADYERLTVYNLFVQNAYGNVNYASFDDFANRRPSDISYTSTASNNPADGAVNWWYGVTSLYAQDEANITDKLSAQLGVRYEVYQADDNIKRNEVFTSRYGFANTYTLTGRGVAMPRFGLTYSPLDNLTLRGGLGLYSGGTPTVWVSNNYTNDGITLADAYVSRNGNNPNDILDGYDGRDIPEQMKQTVTANAEQGLGQVNAMDPNFSIPSTWKASIGTDYAFELPVLGDGFGFTATYTYSRVREAVMWKDLRRNFNDGTTPFAHNTPVGNLPDGRPYYDNGAGTSASANFNYNRGSDLELTNTDKGFGHVVSTGLRKQWNFGLQAYVGYAWQHVEDVSPATSSVARSNYAYAAAGLDPNNPDLATSNYQRTHRIIGVVEYNHSLLGDLLTGVTLLWDSHSGQPFSLTYGGSSTNDSRGLARLFGEDYNIANKNRSLIYVPKGDGSDVTFATPEDEANFNQLSKNFGLDKYKGKIVPRNAFEGPWIHRFDVTLSQQIPTPWSETQKARLVFQIQNVGNLVNSDWGRYDQVTFPYVAPVVMAKVNPDGTYQYSQVQARIPNTVKTFEPLTSVWRIQAGLVYDL